MKLTERQQAEREMEQVNAKIAELKGKLKAAKHSRRADLPVNILLGKITNHIGYLRHFEGEMKKHNPKFTLNSLLASVPAKVPAPRGVAAMKIKAEAEGREFIHPKRGKTKVKVPVETG